jgi:hypothetical protein
MSSEVEGVLTVRDVFALAYGNLAMAHHAVSHGDQKYSRIGYMIRARLTHGLRTGEMSMGSLFDDEKVKSEQGRCCSYCGTRDDLALDHLIPRKRGGQDSGDNLVVACRACNSSKGSKDLLEWCAERNEFPPLMILRRYLKIAAALCETAGVMEELIDSQQLVDLPIAFARFPVSRFPAPTSLRL